MSQQPDPTDYLLPQSAPSMFENPEYFEGDPRDSVFSNVVPRQFSDPQGYRDMHRSQNKPKIAPKPKRLTDYYNDMGTNHFNELPVPDNLRLLSNSSNCSNGESAV